MSKNLNSAQNWSREAGHIQFDTDSGILVANTNPIGSVSVEQIQKNVDYPNVQSAINDLHSLTILPINSVIINSDGVNPSGVSQVDEWAFSGVVAYENLPNGTPVKLNCFGFYCTVLVGDTADEAASKFRLALSTYVNQNIGISDSSVGGTLNVTQITYADFKKHTLSPMTSVGITITPTTISTAKNGYGVWTRVGTELKTLDGSTGSITLYYFRRDN